jgi:hypothetical protein
MMNAVVQKEAAEYQTPNQKRNFHVMLPPE